jgi:multidrug efflux pump subunit AcrA (membrane-fusion protein)
MPTLNPLLPAHRPELLIRPLGDGGQYVVKDPLTGTYYHLGEAEHFLLTQLDGQQTAEAVRAAFEQRFGEPLSAEDFDDFLELARVQRFLQAAAEAGLPPEGETTGQRRQSLLYWRKSLFDPDRLMTWLAPRLRFVWTRGFLIVSAGGILLAAVLVWVNWQEVLRPYASALRWETALWVWLALAVTTTLHEFAHGLTCKHHGGEVHEVGFLLLFFMPCFFCNVSDAWLFREKSKRLWVALAGGYCDLCVWALSVFAWRLTQPGTAVNSLAWVVLSVLGVRVFFNFNPLLKLDGYYLLSDWLEVPNLQQRGQGHFKGHLRRLLWGAPAPPAEPRGRLLLSFGLMSWLYSVLFLALVLWGLFHFLGAKAGWLGVGLVALLGWFSVRGVFQGFTAGEVSIMVTTRRKRTVCWLLALGGLAAALCLVKIEDRAGGSFRLRPPTHAELRAPVAGFLKEVFGDEGDRVSPGAPVARIEVPDLDSRLAQKQAEVREARARLRLLEEGPRYEEVDEQRRRVERAEAWCDLARADLDRARQALDEDLNRLDQLIAQHQAELEFADQSFARAQKLRLLKAISQEEYRDAEKKCHVCAAQRDQTLAERRARRAQGTREAEAELARRSRELADARSALALLEAGSRPAEVEAERARLTRLQEETHYLGGLREKVRVASPVAGLIVTPRLREKVGQYLREGDLIAVVEEPAGLEAEISLAEQDVDRVRAGQEVLLKARALPFEAFATRVERVAPAADKGEAQSSVTVYCRLESAPAGLRPAMTGYARVYTGRRPVGAILLDRVLRFLRTEFWW